MRLFIREIIFSHDHFNLVGCYFVLITSKMPYFSYKQLDTDINTESPTRNAHAYPNY